MREGREKGKEGEKVLKYYPRCLLEAHFCVGAKSRGSEQVVGSGYEGTKNARADVERNWCFP